MTRVYYKEAVGAFIVFDVTRTSTFEAVQKWKKDIDQKVGSEAHLPPASSAAGRLFTPPVRSPATTRCF